MTGLLHLIGHFDDPYTGAERELPDLAACLAGQRETLLWSDVAPHPVYAAQGVRQIQPFAGALPRGGMVLMGGVHVRPDFWLAHVKPQRIALRYNLPNHERLFKVIGQIREATGLDPELLFVSRALQLAVGLPGTLEPSLIRLAPFLSQAVERPPRPFTIGRASRDVIEKHHADDPALYRMLAARGFRVRIMGGTCLAPQLAGVPGIELLPAGAEEISDFYGTLDAFFYRTGTFAEPYGRVVFEAMASGLPVVVSTVGGFAEFIHDGTSAILIHTQERAFDAVAQLAASPSMRISLGLKARERALQLHGDETTEAALQFYLR